MPKPELLKKIADLYSDGVAILQQEEARRAAAAEDEALGEGRSGHSGTKARAKSKTTGKATTTAKAATDEKKNPRLVGILIHDYQNWYSKACPVIRTILPERLDEFEEQYRAPKRKELNYLTYTVSDFLLGVSSTRVNNPYGKFLTKFQHQLTILYSALERASSALDSIEGVLQYELFENEIAAAEDLLKKGHRRAAGALVGVTLEAHLGKVAETRGLKVAKKHPTIADLNDPLRTAAVVDLPMWRLIQRLADIRNLCVHSKDHEPTADEVADLVAGVKKVIAEVS